MTASRNSRPARRDIDALGQIFTPEVVVDAMLALRRNRGSVLEPACGDGAFLRHLPGATAIEIDPRHCPTAARCADFFALPARERFDTIIGNPPYVRFRDIPPATRRRLGGYGLNARASLYLYFIAKSVRHLAPGGELIFITPRDFLKSTAAVPLNRELITRGRFTDVIELGDIRVFDDALPNCLIWRYQAEPVAGPLRYAALQTDRPLGEALASLQWEERHCLEVGGHLVFSRDTNPYRLSDVAQVRVGAVSGADRIYVDALHGNRDFVYSKTAATGRTRRMIWSEDDPEPPAILLPHKRALLARRAAPFNESNWWRWGRSYPQSEAPRVYVNQRTRRLAPFFLHDCPSFDGAILALFPRRTDIDLAAFAAALNGVDWDGLGFFCDGRFIFAQRSLEAAPLPANFSAFLPAEALHTPG
jgi:adenine-specific DNA-methyltransferase